MTVADGVPVPATGITYAHDFAREQERALDHDEYRLLIDVACDAVVDLLSVFGVTASVGVFALNTLALCALRIGAGRELDADGVGPEEAEFIGAVEICPHLHPVAIYCTSLSAFFHPEGVITTQPT